MRANPIAKAISATVACTGLAVAIGAATVGAESPYRELLTVAGIDAFTVGAAAVALLILFSSETTPSSAVSPSPRMRSLDNPEGHELKKMLVRHVAPEKPVTIGFSGDDREAEQFAAQIGRFLHENSFTVVGFAAEPAEVRLEPGIGIDEGNHILVGPMGSRALVPPPPRHSAPDASSADIMPRREPLHAGAGGSP